MKREFAIPMMTTLSMCVTACTGSVEDTFIGEWTATSVLYNGETMAFPYVYTEEYDEGGTYTSSFGMSLSVKADATAILSLDYLYSYSDGTTESDSENYGATWAQSEESKDGFLISFGDEEMISMRCTVVSDAEMNCTGGVFEESSFAKDN